MNTEIAHGKWKEIKGKIKEEWGNFTDDAINEINGNQEKLAGKLEQIYGYNKEKAKKASNAFFKRFQQ